MTRTFLIFQIVLLTSYCLTTDALTDEQLEYKTLTNVAYRSKLRESSYTARRCQLDIYYPTNTKTFATIVWFHGGGLTSGNRTIPVALKNKRLAIVAVGYRLSPKVKVATILDDAAAAVAWTFDNIEKYGGARSLIFIGGHSAGGYITSMLGLNDKLLNAHNIDSNSLAGLIPYSGHTITHFTARAERGIRNTQPIIDEFAPLFHVKKNCSPMLLVTGDRNLELLGRYEENAYFWRMMRVVGNTTTTLKEIKGHNHGQMVSSAHPLLIEFIERRTSLIQGTSD
ncbi:MAG: alpha/beta hydrolase fold domain-containing protein [Pirellulaceae bacterium]|nr:alpha/beta hydrolase fold domain-containing protein [Pirellulaceae bacterium]